MVDNGAPSSSARRTERNPGLQEELSLWGLTHRKFIDEGFLPDGYDRESYLYNLKYLMKAYPNMNEAVTAVKKHKEARVKSGKSGREFDNVIISTDIIAATREKQGGSGKPAKPPTSSAPRPKPQPRLQERLKRWGFTQTEFEKAGFLRRGWDQERYLYKILALQGVEPDRERALKLIKKHKQIRVGKTSQSGQGTDVGPITLDDIIAALQEAKSRPEASQELLGESDGDSSPASRGSREHDHDHDHDREHDDEREYGDDDDSDEEGYDSSEQQITPVPEERQPASRQRNERARDMYVIPDSPVAVARPARSVEHSKKNESEKKNKMRKKRARSEESQEGDDRVNGRQTGSMRSADPGQRARKRRKEVESDASSSDGSSSEALVRRIDVHGASRRSKTAARSAMALIDAASRTSTVPAPRRSIKPSDKSSVKRFADMVCVCAPGVLVTINGESYGPQGMQDGDLDKAISFEFSEDAQSDRHRPSGPFASHWHATLRDATAKDEDGLRFDCSGSDHSDCALSVCGSVLHALCESDTSAVEPVPLALWKLMMQTISHTTGTAAASASFMADITSRPEDFTRAIKDLRLPSIEGLKETWRQSASLHDPEDTKAASSYRTALSDIQRAIAAVQRQARLVEKMQGRTTELAEGERRRGEAQKSILRYKSECVAALKEVEEKQGPGRMFTELAAMAKFAGLIEVTMREVEVGTDTTENIDGMITPRSGSLVEAVQRSTVVLGHITPRLLELKSMVEAREQALTTGWTEFGQERHEQLVKLREKLDVYLNRANGNGGQE